MGLDGEQEQLRQTFDRAAGIYQRARPDYPDELFEDLVTVTGLVAGDRLLEIGCASGKATLPMVRRAFHVTCVELGSSLAAAARRNLAGLDAEVIEAPFEAWRPPPGELFDLVFAATSWHWIDPDVRYERAWQALRPAGHLAFWTAAHVFPDGGDPFFQEIQEIYDEIGEGVAPGTRRLRPGELPDDAVEIDSSGLFLTAHVRHFDWERTYSAEGYIELLDTFSGHIAMREWQRERLYGEMRRRLNRRADGSVRRHWGAVLHVARRVEPG